MTDKRTSQRKRVLKSGTITFAYAAGINCVVRNISDTGGCLEIESPVGIPDKFTLNIHTDNAKYECRVIWRSQKRIGVSFV
ncbi:MAG: PilZ domain-containing protein [Proteobacteria bacterium]|nr:PilZ domain-containing protein [Pseudomonadota bacterium]